MKETKKNIILRILGFFFLIIGVGAIANTLFSDIGLAPILWFSYIGMIILSIGLFKRDSFLIASQINILAIPYIFWTADFIYYLINKKALFNIVNYFFVQGNIIGKIISLQHLITIPISLYAIYLIGLKRKDSWKLSILQIFIVFFITRTFTSIERNVNCVYQNCANFDFGFYYPLEWFSSIIIMILVTNYIVTKLFYKNKKIKK
jgi:hypothetical protein